jgi:hypothetical protein
MNTYKVTKTWTETQSRECSRSRTIQAETEEDAIEQFETMTDGAGSDYETDWDFDDCENEACADAEAELVQEPVTTTN